ncbi:glutamate ligase domain-containing protein, partial [Aggregatibacter actinomycetemcomitans]
QSHGKLIAVCGILKDKDAVGVLTPLLSLIDEWRCVTLGGYRGQRGADLFVTLQQIAAQHHFNVQGNYADSVVEGIKSAVEISDENDTVLVFGSFHTVGEFLTFSQA